MEQKTQISQKKIAFLITKSNFGGAQKYVYQLACEAKKREYKTIVILGGNGLLAEKLKESNIQTYQIDSLKRDFSFFAEIKTLFEIIKILNKEKPDILHLNSSKIGGIGSLAGKICRIKNTIFTIHGWAFNENRSWLSKLIIKKIYWLTIFLSDKTISVSEQTKNQVKKIPFYPIIQKKIIVIKNGIENISFLEKESAREFFKEKFNIQENDFIFGTLAELHPIKGLEYLIGGANQFLNQNPNSNVKFLIFGTGQEKEVLEKMISDFNLQNKVILAGFFENASKYLKGLDVFILTSLSEALPLSVLEAGQAGIPVIATKVGGIPEIIENRKTGILINTGNEKEIFDAINFVLNNKKQMQINSDALKNKISTDFNIEIFYKKTFDLYN